MDPMDKTEEKKDKSKLLLIIVILLLVVCVAGMGVFILTRQPTAVDNTANNNAGQIAPTLKYANEGVTAITEEGIQEAYDDIMSQRDDMIALYFKGEAISTDGTAFDCYIGNSDANKYDAFFCLYADDAMQDMVFLSDLLRPGQVFTGIELTHPLEEGTTTVYCAQTLVEEDLETIHSQTVYTIDFIVRPSE